MEEYQDRSLRGRVFEKLREDILSGVYKDCDELREITIGEEMGVSRTPVREALRQLELEGLVKIIPNKGAYVTGILYEASNSRIMEHTLSDFHKYVKMARMLSVGAKNRAEKSIEEHKAILEAIKKGDADEAERLANLHIMHVMENLHIEIED